MNNKIVVTAALVLPMPAWSAEPEDWNLKLQSTELYLDPEVAHGVPLSGLPGLAGFTNGEIARSSGANPTLYQARPFGRQVINDSAETDDVESGMNQFGGKHAKRRWVLTAGNLSVLNIVDATAWPKIHAPSSRTGP